jgi:uncharacterized protein (DUF3084 family)
LETQNSKVKKNKDRLTAREVAYNEKLGQIQTEESDIKMARQAILKRKEQISRKETLVLELNKRNEKDKERIDKERAEFES